MKYKQAASHSKHDLGARHLVELSKRWASRSVAWIDAQFGSDYRHIYLQHLLSRYRYCQVNGLSAQGPHHLAVQRVFVEPTLVAQTASDCPQAEGNSLWDYLDAEAGDMRNFLLLGAPGSGKTTLLQHIALTLAVQPQPRRQENPQQRLPILLFLPDHADKIKDNLGFPLTQAVHDSLTRFKKPSVPAEWLQSKLKKGQCLVLLDGLDEVVDPCLRIKVGEWVQRQMGEYCNNRFIVTSQPCDCQSHPLRGVHVLHICPLSHEQQARLVHYGSLTHQSLKARKEDAGVRRMALSGAEDLLEYVETTPGLKELVGNPLLLTLTANVYGFRNTLPQSRVDLYAEHCTTALGTFQQERGLTLDLTPPDLTPSQKQRVLQPLAYEMMCRQVHTISLADAVTIVKEPLSKVSARMKPELFLKAIVNESGLLLQRENRAYRFAHLTFQQYLAAVHIHERKLETELAAWVGQSWWHETIRFYCARALDSTSVLNGCLSSGPSTLDTLARVRECMEEARNVRPELRDRLDELLNQQADLLHAHGEGADPRARRAAAETLLALRLRRMARLDADRYVDNTLITHCEYQLFLDERRAQGRYCQPDHWQDHRFPAEQGSSPIVGTRPADAIAFCEWLTQREAGPWRYRLPEVNERVEAIEESPTAAGPIGYWAVSGMRIKCHGLGTAAPILTDERLRHWFDRDVERVAALARALDQGHSPDSRGALALACALGLDRARTVVRDNARALDRDDARALDAELDRARELDRDHTHARAIARTRDLARALALALPSALDRDLEHDLEHTRVLALALTVVLVELLERMRAPRSREMQEFAEIIQRRHESCLDLYVNLVISEERREGLLPAFEGIRIVKERVQAVASQMDITDINVFRTIDQPGAFASVA